MKTKLTGTGGWAAAFIAGIVVATALSGDTAMVGAKAQAVVGQQVTVP